MIAKPLAERLLWSARSPRSPTVVARTESIKGRIKGDEKKRRKLCHNAIERV